jgi:CBS-domain-containing membrane protein
MSHTDKRLKDLLIPLSAYPHMPYWGTLREAIAHLNLAYETGRHTVLVFDESEQAVGLLSQKDILRGIQPELGSDQKTGGPVFWKDLLSSKSRKRLSLPVQEFVSRTSAAGDAGDSLLKAAQALSQEDTDLLPVMENGKLIGVVLMEDLFQEITNAVLKL